MGMNWGTWGRSVAAAAALAVTCSGMSYAVDEVPVDETTANGIVEPAVPTPSEETLQLTVDEATAEQAPAHAEPGGSVDPTLEETATEPTPEEIAAAQAAAELAAEEAAAAELAAKKAADDKAMADALAALDVRVDSDGEVVRQDGNLTLGCAVDWRFSTILSSKLGGAHAYSVSGFAEGVSRDSGVGFFEGQHFFLGASPTFRVPVASKHTIHDAVVVLAVPTAPLGLAPDEGASSPAYEADTSIDFFNRKDDAGDPMWIGKYRGLPAGVPQKRTINGNHYEVYTWDLGTITADAPYSVRFKAKSAPTNTGQPWHAFGTLTGRYDYGTQSCAAPQPAPARASVVPVTQPEPTVAPESTATPEPTTASTSVVAPEPVVSASPAPARVAKAAPSRVPTVTRTFQVDRYTPKTVAQARLLASFDDDGLLKYREDRGLWGASSWQFVTVQVPPDASHAQVMAAINAKTGAVGDVNTNRRIARARVGTSYTVAWELGAGATPAKAWGAKNTVDQKFFARA